MMAMTKKMGSSDQVLSSPKDAKAKRVNNLRSTLPIKDKRRALAETRASWLTHTPDHPVLFCQHLFNGVPMDKFSREHMYSLHVKRFRKKGAGRDSSLV